MPKYKTIPLKPSTYRRLRELKRELEDQLDKRVSWDDAINFLLDRVITSQSCEIVKSEASKRELRPALMDTFLSKPQPSEALESDLPSFFRDNPWLEILANRGQE